MRRVKRMKNSEDKKGREREREKKKLTYCKLVKRHVDIKRKKQKTKVGIIEK